METTETETFTAPDILHTLQRMPGPGVQNVEVDLRPYFPDVCCFEAVAVQSMRTRQGHGALIAPGRTAIVYLMDTDDGHWQDEEASDTLEYVVRDKATGQTAMGSITVQRIPPVHFEAEDIHLMLPLDDMAGHGRPGPWELPLGLLNKFEEVRAVEVGTFDTRLIHSIGFVNGSPDAIVVALNPGCGAWHPGQRTSFDYAITAVAGGEEATAKGRITFEGFARAFWAESVEVEMEWPLPAEVVIDLAEHNGNFAEVSVDSVGTTVALRGQVGHIGGTEVTYTPNPHSGYWDSPDAADMVPSHEPAHGADGLLLHRGAQGRAR